MTEDEQQALLDQADKLMEEAAVRVAQVCVAVGAPRSAEKIAATLHALAGTAVGRGVTREFPPAGTGDET